MPNNQTRKLSNLLNTIGISEVIWIDDCFAQPIDDELKSNIIARVAELEAYGRHSDHPIFTGIDYEAPEEIIEAEINSRLDKHIDNWPEILDSIIKQISNCPQYIPDTNEDFSPAQIKAIMSAFDNVKTYSLAAWNTDKNTILETCSERTLFLIDREFDREGYSPAEMGDDLIASVARTQPLAFCIMLTRTVKDDEVEVLRRHISESAAVAIYKFSVMSKQSCGIYSKDAFTNLMKAMRIVFIHRFCFDLVSQTAAIMKDSLGNSVRELISLSLNAIDTAIFRNSSEEGASELDVVIRILNLHQRIGVQDNTSVQRGEFFAKLQKLRAVRNYAIESSIDPDVQRSSVLLKKWRLREIIDPSTVINLIHSPLCCGDIFQNANDKQYVLIAQPCDLIVRGMDSDTPGGRLAEEGTFVRLYNEVYDTKYESDRYFVIKGIDATNDRSWIFDFREAATVNLGLLDLAVYNEDGKVQWTKDQCKPDALLPGWEKRFSRQQKINRYFALKESEVPREILSQHTKIQQSKAKINDKYYGIPYQRIGRLRSPYSAALLGSYASFIARAAFDHDFAKNVYKESAEPFSEKLTKLFIL
jgi:hypothetical protein